MLVGNNHEPHAGVRLQTCEKLGEGLQTACGGADSDNREIHFPVRLGLVIVLPGLHEKVLL